MKPIEPSALCIIVPCRYPKNWPHIRTTDRCHGEVVTVLRRQPKFDPHVGERVWETTYPKSYPRQRKYYIRRESGLMRIDDDPDAVPQQTDQELVV